MPAQLPPRPPPFMADWTSSPRFPRGGWELKWQLLERIEVCSVINPAVLKNRFQLCGQNLLDLRIQTGNRQRGSFERTSAGGSLHLICCYQPQINKKREKS